jgi:chemotaxis protein histidine kinase CheA
MKKAEKPDGIKFVISEHARFRNLFSDVQDTTEWDTKLLLIRDMISEISTHSANETKYLYELIKEKLPREEMLYQRLLMDNQLSSELLAFLDKNRGNVTSADDRIVFDITVSKFIADELDHMEHEEQMLLKSLNELMSDEEKEQLENDMRWGKDQSSKISASQSTPKVQLAMVDSLLNEEEEEEMKESMKESPKESMKESPKESMKESMKESPKESAKESSKKSKESSKKSKESSKESPREAKGPNQANQESSPAKSS